MGLRVQLRLRKTNALWDALLVSLASRDFFHIRRDGIQSLEPRLYKTLKLFLFVDDEAVRGRHKRQRGSVDLSPTFKHFFGDPK